MNITSMTKWLNRLSVVGIILLCVLAVLAFSHVVSISFYLTLALAVALLFGLVSMSWVKALWVKIKTRFILFRLRSLTKTSL